MNKYYEVIGIIDGQKEILFGSFAKKDCTFELDSEREGWKAEGYKGLKIVSRLTDESPDPEVYKNDIVISTEYLSEHKDFFTLEELETYLDERGLDWVNSDTVCVLDVVNEAIENETPYLVLPVGDYDDLTINFNYGDL